MRRQTAFAPDRLLFRNDYPRKPSISDRTWERAVKLIKRLHGAGRSVSMRRERANGSFWSPIDQHGCLYGDVSGHIVVYWISYTASPGRNHQTTLT
jgi:hypothetical protein